MRAQLGDPAAEELLAMTTTSKVVTVPMDATDVGTIRPGTPVTIVRPDGKEIPAR